MAAIPVRPQSARAERRSDGEAGGAHRAVLPPGQRRMPAGPPPPADPPLLDEDGLPRAPDPERLAKARGIRTDD